MAASPDLTRSHLVALRLSSSFFPFFNVAHFYLPFNQWMSPSLSAESISFFQQLFEFLFLFIFSHPLLLLLNKWIVFPLVIIYAIQTLTETWIQRWILTPTSYRPGEKPCEIPFQEITDSKGLPDGLARRVPQGAPKRPNPNPPPRQPA